MSPIGDGDDEGGAGGAAAAAAAPAPAPAPVLAPTPAPALVPTLVTVVGEVVAVAEVAVLGFLVGVACACGPAAMGDEEGECDRDRVDSHGRRASL